MKIIVQTAETRSVYRSYEIDAADVNYRHWKPGEGVLLGEREAPGFEEHPYGAAKKSYLEDTHQLQAYIDCQDDFGR